MARIKIKTKYLWVLVMILVPIIRPIPIYSPCFISSIWTIFKKAEITFLKLTSLGFLNFLLFNW